MTDFPGIPLAEFQAAQAIFPSLVAARHGRSTTGLTLVTAIALVIEGVNRGGGRVMYRLLSDVANLRHALPQVWVVEPGDGDITHPNIFRASSCPLVGRPLPYLCWGTYPNQWSSAARERRTLPMFLADVHQHLNHPNENSCARS